MDQSFADMLAQEQDSHKETAEILRRVRDHRDQLLAAMQRIAFGESDPVEIAKQALKREPNMRPLPKYCAIYSWAQFVAFAQKRQLTDEDGAAFLATETEVSNIQILPSDAGFFERPDWVTNIVWYNR